MPLFPIPPTPNLSWVKSKTGVPTYVAPGDLSPLCHQWHAIYVRAPGKPKSTCLPGMVKSLRVTGEGEWEFLHLLTLFWTHVSWPLLACPYVPPHKARQPPSFPPILGNKLYLSSGIHLCSVCMRQKRYTKTMTVTSKLLRHRQLIFASTLGQYQVPTDFYV